MSRDSAPDNSLRRLEPGKCGGVAERFRRHLDRGGFGAGLDHLGQRVLLETGFAFDGGNNVGHQIGAALVLIEYLTPSGLGLFVQALKIVVAAACKQQSSREKGKKTFHVGGPVYGKMKWGIPEVARYR